MLAVLNRIMSGDAPESLPERRTGSRVNPGDASERVRSDIARRIDLDQLEDDVMGAVRANTEAVAKIGSRVDSLRDELSHFVVEHSQLHSDWATAWAEKWNGVTAELAYRRGLIGLPRLVLEWLRQYLTTILLIGGLIVAAIGFLTDSLTIGVGGPR